jgi:hypothetical protein
LAHYRQRITDEASGAANSRLNSAKIYGELDAQIRNRLLRKDLAEGKVGLGFLVNMAQAHGRVFAGLTPRSDAKPS